MSGAVLGQFWAGFGSFLERFRGGGLEEEEEEEGGGQ